jgi:hypothetical protein
MLRPERPDYRMSESCALLTKFIFEEYSCESQGACNIFWPFYAFSWASSGRSNEGEEIQLLIEVCSKLGRLRNNPIQFESSEDYRDTILATVDAKQLFYSGTYRLTRKEDRSLHIAMPLQHVIRGHKTVFPSSFKRMRANLQLICFGPSLTGDHDTNYRFFDLSVQLTGYVLEFCAATPDFDEFYLESPGEIVVLAGTPQQRQECLQLIIQEVWQNTDNQLDAWGQLLILACVKKDFSTYWEIVVSDDDSDADTWATSSESPQQPTRPSSPYSASPSKHPSAKAQPHLQPDP